MSRTLIKFIFYSCLTLLLAFVWMAPEQCPKTWLVFCEWIEHIGIVRSEKRADNFYYYGGIALALLLGLGGLLIPSPAKSAEANTLLDRFMPQEKTAVQRVLADAFMLIALLLLPYWFDAGDYDSPRAINFSKGGRPLGGVFVAGLFMLHFLLWMYFSHRVQRCWFRRQQTSVPQPHPPAIQPPEQKQQ